METNSPNNESYPDTLFRITRLKRIGEKPYKLTRNIISYNGNNIQKFKTYKTNIYYQRWVSLPYNKKISKIQIAAHRYNDIQIAIRYESPYVGGTRPYLKSKISRYKPILRQKFPDLVCYNIMKFLNNQWCVDIEEDLICTGRRLNLTFWHKGPILDDEIKLYKNNKIPNVPWITISWYETKLDSNDESFDPECPGINDN
jgi:hypothetical protein